jgi:hypothetical protein
MGQPFQNQSVTMSLQLGLADAECLEKKAIADVAAQCRGDETAACSGSDTGGVAMDVDDGGAGLHKWSPLIGGHHIKSMATGNDLLHAVTITGSVPEE